MRVPGGRPSAVVIAAFAAILILSLAGPSVSAAKAPPGLARFMYAMGKVESGGRYTARNPYSGAYGKYQIMPSNWPAWAKKSSPHGKLGRLFRFCARRNRQIFSILV